MFIVGIVLLVVSYNINPKQQKNPELENITLLNDNIQWALDYAAFSGRIFALTITNEAYYFSEFQPEYDNNIIVNKAASTTWYVVNDNKNLKLKYWQAKNISHIDLTLEGTSIVIDDLEDALEINQPHIFILPYYEITDFKLTIFSKDGNEFSLTPKEVLQFIIN